MPNTSRGVLIQGDGQGSAKVTVSQLSDCMVLETKHVNDGLKHLSVQLDTGFLTSMIPHQQQGTDDWEQAIHHLLDTFHPTTLTIAISRDAAVIQDDSFHVECEDGSIYFCKWNLNEPLILYR